MSRTIKIKIPTVNKTAWKILVAAIVLVAVFLTGSHYGKTSQNSTASNQGQTTNFNAPSAKKGLVDQQALQEQSTKAAQAAKLQPSSGHLNLSGTVSSISSSSVSLTLANGQELTFSLPSDLSVMIVNKDVQHPSSGNQRQHTVKDVKKGDKVNLMVTVNADGTFVARAIRSYNDK